MDTGNYDNGILSAFCNVSCLLGGLGSIMALGSMLLSFSLACVFLTFCFVEWRENGGG